MINYTTKAEYYLQKQIQITLIPTMEGKNTPPKKKKKQTPHKASSKEGQPVHGNPQLQDSMSAFAPSLLFVLEMEIHLLFFFLEDSFECCILISGYSNC